MTAGPVVIDGEHEPTAPAADPLSDARPAGHFAGLGLPLAIAAVVVLVDQLTKHWAQNALIDSSRHIIWTLRFNLSFNSGMAFSAGRGVGPIIGAVAIVVIIVLALSARHAARDSRLAAVAAGLVVGGAIGNLDRPLVPRRRLAARRGDRLRRPAVVPDLQRGRRGHHHRRRVVRHLDVAPDVIVERDPGGAGRRARRPDRRAGHPGQPVRGCGARRRGCRHPRRRGRHVRQAARPRGPVGDHRRDQAAVAAAADGRSGGRRPGRARRRRRHRHRQASRAWSSIPAPGIPTARWSTACWPASPSSPASASRTGRASSTGSTSARAGCSWSPAATPAYHALVEALAAHRVERAYLTLVWGQPENPAGVIDAPIGRDRPRPDADGGRGGRAPGAHRVPRRSATTTGRPSSARCAASCRPGAPTRSASTSRPSATRWSATAPTAASAIRWTCRVRSCTPRRSRLRHPVTNATVHFESPLPPDLAAVVAGLDDAEPSDLDGLG